MNLTNHFAKFFDEQLLQKGKWLIVLIFDTVETKKMRLTYLDGSVKTLQGMSKFPKKKIQE